MSFSKIAVSIVFAILLTLLIIYLTKLRPESKSEDQILFESFLKKMYRVTREKLPKFDHSVVDKFSSTAINLTAGNSTYVWAKSKKEAAKDDTMTISFAIKVNDRCLPSLGTSQDVTFTINQAVVQFTATSDFYYSNRTQATAFSIFLPTPDQHFLGNQKITAGGLGIGINDYFIITFEIAEYVTLYSTTSVQSIYAPSFYRPEALFTVGDLEFHIINVMIIHQYIEETCELYYALASEDFQLYSATTEQNKKEIDPKLSNWVHTALESAPIKVYANSEKDRFPISLTSLLISVVGIIACAICLLSMFMTKTTKNTFIYLTTSYAIANVGIVTIIGIYTGSMIAVNPLYAYDYWTTIWAGQLLTFFEFASLLSYLTQSINRVCAVYVPIKYIRIFSKKRVFRYISIIWLVSFAISFVNMIPECHQYFEPLNFSFDIMATSCGSLMKHGIFYVPKLTIRLLCIATDITCLVKLKLIDRENRKKNANNGGDQTQERKLRRDAWFVFQATANTLIHAPVLLINEFLNYYNSKYPIRLIFWIQTTLSRVLANSLDIVIMTVFTSLTQWYANRTTKPINPDMPTNKPVTHKARLFVVRDNSRSSQNQSGGQNQNLGS